GDQIILDWQNATFQYILQGKRKFMTPLNRRKFIERAASPAGAALAASAMPLRAAPVPATPPPRGGDAANLSGAWFEHDDLPWVGKLSQPRYDIKFEFNVKKITMRDGIKLAANIWRPKAEGKFPVIYM